MKYLPPLALALAVARATPVKRSDPQGIDVSDYQPDVDWTTVVDNGIEFVYIKATQSTDYVSPAFSSQYTGATDAGLIRGGYHFAIPSASSGSAQATYFLDNGGGWSSDGITLPGALDIKTNPYGDDACYGLTTSEMVSWLHDFSDTYESSTGRYPVIYTTTDWWNDCTASNADFASDNPLWIADWASTLGPLPAGWEYTSFWQYDDEGPNPGDADLWNGDYSGLESMAYGHSV